MKSTRFLLCSLWFLTALIGCLPSKDSSSPYPATATLQISNTSLASPTIQSATTPIVIATDSMPTVLPKLEVSDAYLLLQEFLKNDSLCQLPCWGGVTPGVSTVSEAEEEFMKLSSISHSKFTYFGQSGDAWYVGSLNILYSLLNTQVDVSPGFVASSDNMTVINIRIYSQSLPYQNSTGSYYGDKEYNVLLSAYMMPQIFTIYGLPNLIYTRADINAAEPTASDLFIIRLLYLDLGIFITYEMPIKEKGDAYLFCPSESLITLDLVPQDIGENYQDFFQQFGVGEWTTLQKTHHQLLEDALGITNEEFSQIITSSPETCFESLIENWRAP